MAKKVSGYIKLQIPAGQANPAPPVGPALGQHGVNIMEFCKQYNAVTKDQAGLVIPVVITVYQEEEEKAFGSRLLNYFLTPDTSLPCVVKETKFPLKCC